MALLLRLDEREKMLAKCGSGLALRASAYAHRRARKMIWPDYLR